MQERKVAIVSGGGRGLGAGVSARLLDEGYRVACFSRRESAFVRAQRERDPAGESFDWAEIDTTDSERVARFVREVSTKYGRVDALVNCAAMLVDGLFTLDRPAEIDRMISVNLTGLIHLTRAVAKQMLVQGSGVIVNVSSVNGLRGNKGVAAYSATKAALDGLTRSLARELGPRNIRVNSVAPGYFESEMVKGLTAESRASIVRRTPLGRLGTVSDIVGTIRFLLSDDARFITGQTLVVDGGLTC